MRAVANGAAFAHGFVFENKGPRLLPVTLRAVFILPRHRQTTGGFENIRAVWVMALHAIHSVFENGMAVRQLKLGVRFKVALKARCGIFPGIDDEFSAPAPRRDVLARRAVTRFATGAARQFLLIEMNSRMNASWKFLQDRRMTIGARLVPDEGRSWNFQRSQHGGTWRRTGAQHENRQGKRHEQTEEQSVMKVETTRPNQKSSELSWLKHVFALDLFSSKATIRKAGHHP